MVASNPQTHHPTLEATLRSRRQQYHLPDWNFRYSANPACLTKVFVECKCKAEQQEAEKWSFHQTSPRLQFRTPLCHPHHGVDWPASTLRRPFTATHRDVASQTDTALQPALFCRLDPAGDRCPSLHSHAPCPSTSFPPSDLELLPAHQTLFYHNLSPYRKWLPPVYSTPTSVHLQFDCRTSPSNPQSLTLLSLQCSSSTPDCFGAGALHSFRLYLRLPHRTRVSHLPKYVFAM